MIRHTRQIIWIITIATIVAVCLVTDVYATDWGKKDQGSLSTGVVHSRAMSGTSPNIENMKITSVSAYLSGTSDVRLAVYTGGALDDPTAATLLWDAGTVNPGGVAGWYSIQHPSGGVSWPANTVTWVAWKSNASSTIYYHDSTAPEGYNGDFQLALGRNNNSFNQDPAVAFPSPYGETGSFAAYWYSVYVTYNAPPSAPQSPLCEDASNPTSVVDATPEFSAIYDDPDTSDTSSDYQIQVNSSSDFWWNNSWTRRRKLTFDNSSQTEDLTNFPVLVVLNSSRIDYGHTQNNGEDIRFVDTDGTPLDYEIETWNESGSSYVWVKVPEITGSSSTDYIYMYYGNSGASDGQDAAGVWSDYSMVYHLNDSSSSLTDSTGNTSGTGSSGISYQQTGAIGYAVDVSSATGIGCGTLGSPLLTAETTVSFWIYCNNIASPERQNPFNQAYGGWGTMTLETSGYISWFFGDNGGNGANYGSHASAGSFITTGSWIYVTATRNPTGYEYKWYKNGSYTNGNTYPSTYPVIADQTFTIGDGYVNPINGLMDEFRVCTIARSADWVAAEHKAMIDDSFISSFGTEQTNAVDKWNPGKSSMTSTDEGSRCPDITYAGSTLNSGTTYYWRIKFWDNSDIEGPWSATQNFTMAGVGAQATDTTITVQRGSGASTSDFKLIFNETDAGASQGYIGGVSGDWSANYLSALELLTELDQDTDYKVDKTSFLELLETGPSRTVLSNEYSLGSEAKVTEYHTIYPKGKVYKETEYKKLRAGTEARRVDDGYTDFIASGMHGYFGSTPSTTRVEAVTYNDYQLMDVIGTATAEITDYQNPDTLDFSVGGTVSGDERWDEAQTSTGVMFAGTGSADYINIGDPVGGELDFGTADFTVELWIKVDVSTAFQLLLYKGGSSLGNEGYDFEISPSSHRVGFNIADSGSGYGAVSSTSIVDDGKWHHVVGVCDRTGVLGTANRSYIFIDGVQEGGPNDISSVGSISTTTALEISRNSTYTVNGVIDEVRIWNDVRTLTEIKENMYKELTGSEAGLAGYWKLNEGSGTNAADSSTNSNNGTLTNGPSWVTGYVGDGYNEAEGCYTVTAGGDYATGTPQAAFDLDGSSNQRYNPAFKIRHFTSFTDPNYYIEGTLKTSGTDYIAGLAPFTDACLINDNSDAPALMTDVAEGGDVGDSDEKLASISQDETLTLTRHDLSFDGTNDYVQIASGNLNITGDLTIEAWVYTAIPARCEIVFKHYNNEYDFGLEPGGGFNFWHGDGAWEGVNNVAPGSVPSNVWTHVTAVRTMSDSKVRFYSNGKYRGEWSFSKTPTTSSYSVLIGSRSGSSQPFMGKIDDVRIWNKARSQADIQADMNKELTGSESGLLAYWKFDDASGQTAVDSAGSNDGQLGSTTGTDDNDPTWSSQIKDSIYFSSHQKFYGLNIDLDTNGTGGDGDWEYWDGDSWEDVSVSEAATNASKLYADGAIYWDDADVSGWQKTAMASGSEAGCVGYWDLNEGSGTAANDRTGTGNNGTIAGTYSWSSGRSGLGIDFSSTSAAGYVSIPDSPSLDISDTITIEFWFYPRSNTVEYANHPIQKYPGTTNANYNLYWFGSDNSLRMYATAGGSWGIVSPGYVTQQMNRWYHVVWTYDSSVGGHLYIDGVDIGLYETTGALSTNDTNVYIRKDNADGSYKMDEVRIFNTVRTPAQIKADYERGRPYYQVRYVTSTAYTTNPIENLIKTDLMVIQDLTNTFDTATSDTVHINIAELIPSAPTALTALAQSDQPLNSGLGKVNLSWTDNSSNETGFKIERKTTQEGTYAQIDTVTANQTTYSNPSLDDCVEYVYRVRAYNDSGDSDYTNDAIANTFDRTAPSNVSGATETGGAQDGVLQSTVSNPAFTWSAPSDNAAGSGIAGYYWYFGTNSGADAATACSPFSSTSCDPSAVSNYNRHYLRLKTEDAEGNYTSSATNFTFIYVPTCEPTPTNKSATTWYQGDADTEVFTFSHSGVGSEFTKYYYKWDRNASSSVTTGDPSDWTSTSKNFTPYTSKKMYLHVRPANSNNDLGPQSDLGPFYFVDTERLLKHGQFFDDDGEIKRYGF